MRHMRMACNHLGLPQPWVVHAYTRLKFQTGKPDLRILWDPKGPDSHGMPLPPQVPSPPPEPAHDDIGLDMIVIIMIPYVDV